MNQVLGIARAGRTQAFQDQFGASMDKLDKLAGAPGADIAGINSAIDSYRPLALDAGVKPEDFDRAAQAFKDRNWLNQATQRAMESKDDMGSLQQLEHDLTDADGYYAGKLDTDRRNALLRGVIGYQDTLQNRLDHEQEKRELQGQIVLRHIDEQTASGIPATPAMWAQWSSAVKGTAAEPEFAQRVNDEATIQHVLRLPMDQQFKYIEDRQQELDQQGGDIHDKVTLDRLRATVSGNIKQMQDMPLIFDSNRNGTLVQPLKFDQLNTPDGQQAFASNIADRMATLARMRRDYGPQVPVQPLLPQEAQLLATQLRDSTPMQRASLLTSMHTAFHDDDAYQAAMTQLAPGSPVTAIAGQMTGQAKQDGGPTWYDRQYAPSLLDAERVLQGEGLLNPAASGSPAGAEKSGYRNLPETTGGQRPQEVFGYKAAGLFEDRPQLAQAYFSAFRDVYASLLTEHGQVSAVGNSQLQDQALRIALGNIVTFNGGRFSVPAGMDPTHFSGLVRIAVENAANTMKAPTGWVDKIDGYGLREIGGLGSGRYELTMGSQVIGRPDGQGPFVIDLHKQFLPGSAAAAQQEAAENAPNPVIGAAMAGQIGR